MTCLKDKTLPRSSGHDEEKGSRKENDECAYKNQIYLNDT